MSLFTQKRCGVYTNRPRTMSSIWRLDFVWNLAIEPFIKSVRIVSQLLLNWFIFLKHTLYFIKLQRLALHFVFYLQPMFSATCMWHSTPIINIRLRCNILKWHTCIWHSPSLINIWLRCNILKWHTWSKSVPVCSALTLTLTLSILGIWNLHVQCHLYVTARFCTFTMCYMNYFWKVWQW